MGRCEHAIDQGWTSENPVRRAERPGRRRTEANPDLQFLSVSELEAVIRAIPDQVVIREPVPSRRGRPGPPPPSPDVLAPVLRVVILTAAMTGLRQSELLGLRWRDIDQETQRIRVRNTFVRGEHSSEGKAELSTHRSVPRAGRLARELELWSRRSAYDQDDDLVFAHPTKGTSLDGSKLSKRFKAACVDAGVRPSASTTSATHSRRGSQRPAPRSARFRSSSGTRTVRRPRSTLTTRCPSTILQPVGAAFEPDARKGRAEQMEGPVVQ